MFIYGFNLKLNEWKVDNGVTQFFALPVYLGTVGSLLAKECCVSFLGVFLCDAQGSYSAYATK